MKLLTIPALLLLLLPACGGGGGGSAKSASNSKSGASGSSSVGSSSPEDVAKSVVSAIGSADIGKFKSLYPSADGVNGIMKCDGPQDRYLWNGLLELVEKEKANLDSSFGLRIKKYLAQGRKVEFVSAKFQSKDTIKKGEKMGGCEATSDFEIVFMKIKVKYTWKDAIGERNRGMRMVKIDGEWYLMETFSLQ